MEGLQKESYTKTEVEEMIKGLAMMAARDTHMAIEAIKASKTSFEKFCTASVRMVSTVFVWALVGTGIAGLVWVLAFLAGSIKSMLGG